jgi:hypothetical protein
VKRQSGGKVYLMLIYADDIVVIADDMEFDRLQEAFANEFRRITMEVSNV